MWGARGGRLSPNVYIIAGPNGAGKTTFANKFLPRYADCRNFVNADLIAGGLSPMAAESAAFRAGRLVLSEIERYVERRQDFGFETTLAGRTYLRFLRRIKRAGYKVHIFFLWIPRVDLAISRIRSRVREGGHSVPPADVRRRFSRSANNFFSQYSTLADSYTLFDNSGPSPRQIAWKKKGRLRIMDHAFFSSLRKRFGK
ncbi:MAG: zeta toxin family protein [Acidobacteria bacterium]|nr:zeta toxin family protein [Acidobacteriota bacterium]